jgi:hypothetical protein
MPHPSLPGSDAIITLFGRALKVWYIGTNKLSPLAIIYLTIGDGGIT